MNKPGTITFKQKDGKSHFYYSFKISSYHAAKILEYISLVEHEVVPFRDGKGRFTSVSDLVGTHPNANTEPIKSAKGLPKERQ